MMLGLQQSAKQMTLTKRPVVRAVRPMPALLQKRASVPAQTRTDSIACRVSAADLEYGSYIVGKGIILFVMFYSSMNWWHYRAINKEIEKQTKKDGDKKTDDGKK